VARLKTCPHMELKVRGLNPTADKKIEGKYLEQR
jgi:hypothetical protein